MYQVRVECPDFRDLKAEEVAVQVKVSWPELQLMDWQKDANAIAEMCRKGDKTPWPDNSTFEVVVSVPGYVRDMQELIDELEVMVAKLEDELEIERDSYRDHRPDD